MVRVNNQWPIPALSFTEGDNVIITVNNHLSDQSTSLHVCLSPGQSNSTMTDFIDSWNVSEWHQLGRWTSRSHSVRYSTGIFIHLQLHFRTKWYILDPFSHLRTIPGRSSNAVHYTCQERDIYLRCRIHGESDGDQSSLAHTHIVDFAIGLVS